MRPLWSQVQEGDPPPGRACNMANKPRLRESRGGVEALLGMGWCLPRACCLVEPCEEGSDDPYSRQSDSLPCGRLQMPPPSPKLKQLPYLSGA